jgi:hypothetical protein
LRRVEKRNHFATLADRCRRGKSPRVSAGVSPKEMELLRTFAITTQLKAHYPILAASRSHSTRYPKPSSRRRLEYLARCPPSVPLAA